MVFGLENFLVVLVGQGQVLVQARVAVHQADSDGEVLRRPIEVLRQVVAATEQVVGGDTIGTRGPLVIGERPEKVLGFRPGAAVHQLMRLDQGRFKGRPPTRRCWPGVR